MKLFHLSDLHIGKRVNEISMIEDQEYILLQILQIIDEEKSDAVLIAGDVYDKSVPSAEAVTLFDDFLFRLAKRKIDPDKLTDHLPDGKEKRETADRSLIKKLFSKKRKK